jgi:putative transposase
MMKLITPDHLFSQHLDESIGRLGVTVLKPPPRSPMANAVCERVIGTIRRECVDWVIPLSEHHLRRILKSWICPARAAANEQD